MSGLPPSHQLDSPSSHAPSYWTLFPARCSPHAAAAEAHSRDWRARHGLASERADLGRLDVTPTGLIAARLFPDASLDVLELAADILLWLTTLDDLQIEAADATPIKLAPLIASFVSVLEGGSARLASVLAPGFPQALGEIRQRLHDLLTPVQAARVITALHQNLFAMLWEGTTRGRRVEFDEYAAMRPFSVSGCVVAALVEPGAGLNLKGVDRESSGLRAVDHHLARLIGWTNDVYSHAYEQWNSADTGPSLPLLLAREFGCGTEEALALACRMCDEEARRLHRLIERLDNAREKLLRSYGAAARLAAGSGLDLYTGLLKERYTPTLAPLDS